MCVRVRLYSSFSLKVQTKLGEYAEKCKEVAEIVKSYEDILKVKESKSAALKKARGSSSSTKKSENVKKKEKAYSEASNRTLPLSLSPSIPPLKRARGYTPA